jgi:hypothetical protein
VDVRLTGHRRWLSDGLALSEGRGTKERWTRLCLLTPAGAPQARKSLRSPVRKFTPHEAAIVAARTLTGWIGRDQGKVSMSQALVDLDEEAGSDSPCLGRPRASSFRNSRAVLKDSPCSLRDCREAIPKGKQQKPAMAISSQGRAFIFSNFYNIAMREKLNGQAKRERQRAYGWPANTRLTSTSCSDRSHLQRRLI